MTNKQTIYPKLTTRLFATVVDLIILVIVTNPIISFLSIRVLLLCFPEYSMKTPNNEELSKIFSSVDFTDTRYIKYICFMLVIQVILMMSYFSLMWKYFGTTIGKYLMRIKIIDEKTGNKPTILQCITRFILYPTIIVGMLSIIFSSKKRGLHDKISGIILVKI